MILYLVPFERVGDFELGGDLINYKENYNFDYSPADDSTGWETYSIQDEGLSIYTEANKIVSIACDEECLYNGRNVIGMFIDEFVSFFNMQSTGEVDTYVKENNIIQNIYEFDEIGLQVWCENDLIVTVIASPFIEDEE